MGSNDQSIECKHEDLDRVGTEEIVCFDCKMICNFVEGAATGVMVWRPISSLGG